MHFLAVSLLVATAAFFLVGRLLGPGIAGLPGRRRQQGLFTQAGEGEQLEFGYCFDVSLFALLGTIEEEFNVSCWSGCDTSFLPGLDVVVRHAICPLAANI